MNCRLTKGMETLVTQGLLPKLLQIASNLDSVVGVGCGLCPALLADSMSIQRCRQLARARVRSCLQLVAGSVAARPLTHRCCSRGGHHVLSLIVIFIRTVVACHPYHGCCQGDKPGGTTTGNAYGILSMESQSRRLADLLFFLQVSMRRLC
jgi:hypothetical protein